MTTTNTTKTIRGHKITLRAGAHYRATRPIGPRPNTPVTVTIEEAGFHVSSKPLCTITCNDYKDADKFLRSFNGPGSFSTRLW